MRLEMQGVILDSQRPNRATIICEIDRIPLNMLNNLPSIIEISLTLMKKQEVFDPDHLHLV